MPRGVSSGRERAGLHRDGLKTNHATAGRPGDKGDRPQRSLLRSGRCRRRCGRRGRRGRRGRAAFRRRRRSGRGRCGGRGRRGRAAFGCRRCSRRSRRRGRRSRRRSGRGCRRRGRRAGRRCSRRGRSPGRRSRRRTGRGRGRRAGRRCGRRTGRRRGRRAGRGCGRLRRFGLERVNLGQEVPLSLEFRRRACGRLLLLASGGPGHSYGQGETAQENQHAAAHRTIPFLALVHSPIVSGENGFSTEIRRGRLSGRDRRFWHAEPLICHSEEPAAAGDEESRLVGAPHSQILRSLRSLRMTTWAACDEKRSHPPIRSPGS